MKVLRQNISAKQSTRSFQVPVDETSAVRPLLVWSVLIWAVLAGALTISTARSVLAEPDDRGPRIDSVKGDSAKTDRYGRRLPPNPVEPALTSERYARPLPVELVEEPLAQEPAAVKKSPSNKAT